MNNEDKKGGLLGRLTGAISGVMFEAEDGTAANVASGGNQGSPDNTPTVQTGTTSPVMQKSANASTEIPQDIMDVTRKGILDIPGSIYSSFCTGLKKIDDVPGMTFDQKIRATLAVHDIKAPDLIEAIQQTHMGKLQSWRANVEQQQQESYDKKVGQKEQHLKELGEANKSISQQIADLTRKKAENDKQFDAIQHEITQEKAQLQVVTQHYADAASLIEQELQQTVKTLQSLQ